MGANFMKEKQQIVLCAAAATLEQGPEKGAVSIAKHHQPSHYARLRIETFHTMKDFKAKF